MKTTIAAVMMAAALMTGCGANSPAAPTPPPAAQVNLTGNWAGTSQDSIGGPGSLRTTIVQNGTTFNGTWASTFNNPSYNNGGTLDGTVNGTNITGVLRSNAGCPLNATFLVNGNSITGTYAALNCTVSITGGFSLTR